MVAIGVPYLLEILVGLNQSLGILVGVLRMHIVVGHAMADEQRSMLLVGTLDRVHLVSLLVLLRGAHVTLGVYRVVEAIAGRRSHSHASLEHRATLAHAHQGVETTIAPAPDADVVLVYVWQRAHIESGLHLVFRLQVAQAQVGAFLKVCATTTGASAIHTSHDETFLCQIVVEGTAIAHAARAPRVEHLLVARSRILEEDDWIFLAGIKIEWLHHPAVELHALRGGEGEGLTLAPVVFLRFLQERLVVFQGLDELALVAAHGVDVWVAVRAPVVDEITIVAREIGRVGTLLVGESLHLAILVRHIHLSVVGIELGCLEIYIARLLVHAIDVGHVVVALLHLSQQLAVHVVEIEVHVAVAVARQQDGLLTHDAVLHHLFLHKLRHALLDELLALAGERIHRVEAHVVLMAIHGVYYQAVGIGRCLDARIVAVGIHRHIERHRLAVLQVVAPEAHLRVVLPRLRVLVGILARIVVKLGSRRMGTLEELQAIGLHLRLVETNPSEGTAVGIPGKGTIEAELLLVYPVGDAIDHLVELAVAGHLHLLLAVGHEEVIVLDEGDVAGVGRPSGHLLVLALRKLLQALLGDIVDEVFCLERTAINSLALGDNEQFLAVRAHHIAVYRLEGSLGCIDVEEHSHLLARLERVTYNLLAIVADGSIQVGTIYRIDTCNIRGSELTRGDSLQVELVSRLHC